MEVREHFVHELARNIETRLPILLMEVTALHEKDVGVLPQEPQIELVGLNPRRVVEVLECVPTRRIAATRDYGDARGVVLRILQILVRRHERRAILVRVKNALRPGEF